MAVKALYLRAFGAGAAGLLLAAPPAYAASSTKTYTANAAVTSSAGDNTGFEGTSGSAPTDATTSNNGYLTDTNSGTNDNDACVEAGSERHQFSTFGFAIPNGATIDGIEVTLEIRVDDHNTNGPKTGALISYDGTNFCDDLGNCNAAPNGNLKAYSAGNTDETKTWGSSSNTWGRTWAASEFNAATFTVMTCNTDTNASSATRDFSLDYLSVTVHYTVRTWDGGGVDGTCGGAGTADYVSCAANWDGDVALAAGAATVFPSGTGSAIWDASAPASVAGVTLQSGFGGLRLDRGLTVTSDVSLSAASLSLNGQDLTVQGGDISGGGTIYCGNGDNTCSAGKVTLSGTGSLGSGTFTFYNLDIGAGASTSTITAAAGFEVKGVLTVVSSTGTNTLDLSTYTLTLSGSGTPLVVSASEVLTTNNDATVSYTSATGATIATSNVNYAALTINGSGQTFTVGGTLNITAGTANVLTLTAGTLAVGSNSVTMGSSVFKTTHIVGAGNYSQSGGTTYLEGSGYLGGTSSSGCSGTSGTYTFNNLTLLATGFFVPATTTITTCGDFTVAGTLTTEATDGLTVGPSGLHGGARTITLSGSGTPFVNGGFFTASTSTVKHTSASGATVRTSGTTYYNLTIDSAGQSFVIGGTLNVTNDLAVTAGNLSLNAQNVNVSGGDFTNAGTVYCGNGNNTCAAGTVTMKGSSDTGVGGAGTTTLYDLVIGDGTSTAAIDLAGTVTVTNDVTVTSSTGQNTFSLNAKNLTINGGDFLVNNNATGNAELMYCGNGNNTCAAGTLTVAGAGSIGGAGGTFTAYSLVLSGASQTTTFAGNVEAKAAFYCGNGTAHVCDTSGSNYSLTAAGNFAIFGPAGGANAEFKANGSTVTATGLVWLTEPLGDATKKGTYTGGTSTLVLTYDTPFLCQLVVKSNGTLDFSTATVKMQNTATACVPAASSFANLEVGTTSDTASAATYTLLNDTVVTGNVTVGHASSTNADVLALSTYNLTVGSSFGQGHIVGRGNITQSASATTTMKGNGNLGGTSSAEPGNCSGTSGTYTFYNLTLGDGTNALNTYACGNFTVSNVLTIRGTGGGDAVDHTFNGLSKTVTLTGTGTPFVKNGVFTYSTSAVSYEPAAASPDTFVTSGDYYNLQMVAPQSTTLKLAGNVTANGTGFAFVVKGTFPTTTTLDTTTNNYAISVPNGTLLIGVNGFASIGSLTANGSTITLGEDLNLSLGTFTQGTSATTVGGSLAITAATSVFTKGSGTLTFGGTGTTKTLSDTSTSGQDLGTVIVDGAYTTSTAIKMTSLTINNTKSLDISGDNLTLTGTGTPLTITGTLTENASSTVTFAATSGTTTVNARTYGGNLTINGSGGTFDTGGNMAVTGTLTGTAGTFRVGSSHEVTAANVTVNGGTLSLPNSGGQLKVASGGTLAMSSGTFSASDVATAPILTTSGTPGTHFYTVNLTGGTLNVAELDVHSVASAGFQIGSGVTITNFNKVTWNSDSQTGGTDILLKLTDQTANLVSHAFPASWAGGDCNVQASTSGVVSMWDWTGAYGGEENDCDSSGGEVVWKGGVGDVGSSSGTHQYPAIY